MLLDKINSPSDLKKLNIGELNTLCAEIRSFLIDTISDTGGHLASNLGVVELTVAIHYIFDLPHDKLVFDVGHQSYVHKLLTGRRERFRTLRKYNGLSGFPKRDESEYDCFNTGHSSTSISAALGLARARDLNGEKSHVLALFGDGALTGGMMYEAMNDAGHSKTPLILILNDNNMSIAKNVGSVSKHLQKLRLSPRYFRSKQAVERFLNLIPCGGNSLAMRIRRLKRQFRRLVLPTSLFDDLGFVYIGPVNGHSLEELTAALSYAKAEGKPILIHVLTTKGKGYSPAEKNPQKFHGVAPFNKITGTSPKAAETYSAHFGKTVLDMAKTNPKIIAITGAMPSGTGLEAFAEKFKDRFFDVGIAEQHGVTMSAGLAAGGYIPVIPLYSSFLQRAYDQTLHDVCLQNLHVVFPIDRAGVVGSDGETHQGIYDISYLSHMPNMKILSPSNFKQLDEMLDFAINKCSSPIAVRYPKGSKQLDIPLPPFEPGKAVTLFEGTDLTIIASGRMAIRAKEVHDALKERNVSAEVMLLPTIKPLDKEAIIKSAEKTHYVITLEDNVILGGMGQMISAVLLEHGADTKFKIRGFRDEIVPQGSVADIDALHGLDTDTLVSDILADFKAE